MVGKDQLLKPKNEGEKPKVDYIDMINLFTGLEKSESGFVLIDV